MIYFDRRGAQFEPSDSDIVKDRAGAFCVCICDDKILFNIEDHAPEHPSLPGGGIDEGENALQAAKREFLEETGMTFPENLIPSGKFVQNIKLYADDVNEYWDYCQTYFLFHINPDTEIFFSEQRSNPSGYYSFWDDVKSIQDSALHHENKRALKTILEM